MSDHIEFEHNGMARCGLCGEPTVPVLLGDPRKVENDPNVIIRCLACAATEEAEAITANASSESDSRDGR